MEAEEKQFVKYIISSFQKVIRSFKLQFLKLLSEIETLMRSVETYLSC